MMKIDLPFHFLQWTALNNSDGRWTFNTTPANGSPTDNVYIGYYAGLYEGNVFYGVKAQDPNGTPALFDISDDGPIGDPVK